MRNWFVLGFVLGLVLLAGCSSGGSSSVTFEFVHGTEPGAPTYRATTSDADLIAEARAELEQPLVARQKMINGLIGAGAGDDNLPWNWHFEKNAWEFAEVTTEVCDAQPSYVSEHLQEWIEDGGRYCPWSSRVAREL